MYSGSRSFREETRLGERWAVDGSAGGGEVQSGGHACCLRRIAATIGQSFWIVADSLLKVSRFLEWFPDHTAVW